MRHAPLPRPEVPTGRNPLSTLYRLPLEIIRKPLYGAQARPNASAPNHPSGIERSVVAEAVPQRKLKIAKRGPFIEGGDANPSPAERLGDGLEAYATTNAVFEDIRREFGGHDHQLVRGERREPELAREIARHPLDSENVTAMDNAQVASGHVALFPPYVNDDGIGRGLRERPRRAFRLEALDPHGSHRELNEPCRHGPNVVESADTL